MGQPIWLNQIFPMQIMELATASHIVSGNALDEVESGEHLTSPHARFGFFRLDPLLGAGVVD